MFASSSRATKCGVSILILLEVVLEVDGYFKAYIKIASFNPYFAGSSSGRSCRVVTITQSVCFNPYFAGSSSGRKREIWRSFGISSFNPYFAGSSSGSKSYLIVLFNFFFVSILILLEVVLEEAPSNITIVMYCSFNPYFAGSSSGS